MNPIIVVTFTVCLFVCTLGTYCDPKEKNATLTSDKKCEPANNTDCIGTNSPCTDPKNHVCVQKIDPHCGQGAGAGQGQCGGQEQGEVSNGDQNINLTNDETTIIKRT